MATLSSLTTSVINYLDAKITAATATSEDIVLQSKALQQLGDAQDLLNAVSIEIPADSVDFSAGQVFTKTLGANTTLTFTTAPLSGYSIEVITVGLISVASTSTGSDKKLGVYGLVGLTETYYSTLLS